ncbi:hypothetical protein [Blastococcus sp. VKM Ac-2987]|uniref:hypothetical protein n=1 Tax=Blastococcus sp. VKM Ac-2987 TaxID=3004141 RepID=UPI0022AB70FA|nr:hypothetical protein [Blastococcus sp. VKM Ac-2987]MCZ2857421.1 hypothetical protein [Blastococcus sp. VKM Ac-2987]
MSQVREPFSGDPVPEGITNADIAEYILNYQGNGERFDTWISKVKEGLVAQAQLDTLQEQRTTLRWQKISALLTAVAALLAAVSVTLQVFLS